MTDITLTTTAKPLDNEHILGLRSHVATATVGDATYDVSTSGAHLFVEATDPYKALIIALLPLIEQAIEALSDVPPHTLLGTRPEEG